MNAPHIENTASQPHQEFKTFEEFWPFYLKEHSSPKNRKLHFMGTNLVFAILLASLVTQSWWLLWLLPIVGYGFAWVGHFFIQKNKPATFRHPIWSLRGDFKMYFCMLAGKLSEEYQKTKDSE